VLRSVVAVSAGFFVTVTLSLGADALLRFVWPTAFDVGGATTNAAVLVIALVYWFAFAALGAYVAARTAVHHRMRHAMILGAIAFAIGVVLAVGAWSLAPAWYHVSALLVVLVSAWTGGRLGQDVSRSPAAAPGSYADSAANTLS
jgi:hypothetical protein